MTEEKELVSKSRLCQTLNILIKKEVDISILFISENYDMYNNLIYHQHHYIHYTCDRLDISHDKTVSHRYLTHDEFILLKMELQGI